MDIILLLRSCQEYGKNMFTEAWSSYVIYELRSSAFMYILIGVLTFALMAGFLWYKRRLHNKEIERRMRAQESVSSAQDMRGLRFRKRDKMLFYGRRMLRKVKNVSGQMYGGQGRKRRAVMRFAKRLLQLRRENIPLQMRTVEPPAEYLEEMIEGSDKVPPDALYMLQSIRIFGHFEKPIFLKLCKHTEVLSLEAGDYLFKISDNDDSVFIVQSGQIHVYILNTDGSTLSLKTVKKGESVTSLLSFIDVLSGLPSRYLTVTAKAVEKSTVIRLPMRAFEEVFQENPDIMIRVIQVIMVRLQRVLFTALRNYLGLNAELVHNFMRSKRNAPHPTNISMQRLSPAATPLIRRSTMAEHSLSDYIHPPDMLLDLAHDPQMQPPLPPAATAPMTQTTDASHLSRRQSLQQPILELINAPVIDSKLIQASAVESFLREFGLRDEDRPFLEPFVEVCEVEPGNVLINEGNAEHACVWFVMTGGLAVYQRGVNPLRSTKTESGEVHIHNVHPGEIVGGLAILTGEASAYTIRARSVSRVGFIRRAGIYSIMRERPRIVLDLASGVTRRLSPLVRQCDFALDWIFLESGRAVYRQDESSDSTYIVLSGRMRSVQTHPNGKKEIIGEYGKGDLVGIVEMITETQRTTTVLAVRDSELARLPEGLFNAIKLRYPVVVTKLISFLSHTMLGAMQTRGGTPSAPLEANPVTHKFSTIALVPVSDDIPITAFTYELYHSLSAIGPTLRLTSEVIRKQLGAHIFEPSNEYRMTSWLDQQEDRNIITLYQCDSSLSAWTQRCMRQADVILILGLGDRPHTVGKFEREIDRLAMRTQKELVLLYHESITTKPNNTLQWLNARPWVTKHHHMLCPKRMFTRRSQYRINDLYSRVLMSEPNMHSDFSRLARWLTGNSIGVVLGGGGARGAAHIGMLKAIYEAGIPVDMVGGVSIGALMGALWCSERNVTTVTQKAREWSKKMTKWFLQLLDLTYPIVSMFSGREFNKTIRDTFGDVSIEDLWIPYFTLTTDITASCHRIHTCGSLWRYIRSSMSLSGYMPPLCDPKDGHLLLDGGYVNNLPADVMHNLGAAHIIAIDVGSQDDTDLTNYGDDLSGWWLLYKRWNPFTTPVKVPDLPDIQTRLAYVSCVRQLEVVKTSEYCEYIRPPIDKYKTLAFGSFDEIRDVGYVYGKNYFEKMDKDGRLGRFNKWSNKEPPKKNYYHSTLYEYTFIDLAQIVCKLPETYVEHQQNYLFSEDEDFDGYISEPSTYNRVQKIKLKRTGTSLSLSENEFDSDVEIDLSLDIRHDKTLKKRSTPASPASNTSFSESLMYSASEVAATANANAADVAKVEELPLDVEDKEKEKTASNEEEAAAKKNQEEPKDEDQNKT